MNRRPTPADIVASLSAVKLLPLLHQPQMPRRRQAADLCGNLDRIRQGHDRQPLVSPDVAMGHDRGVVKLADDVADRRAGATHDSSCRKPNWIVTHAESPGSLGSKITHLHERVMVNGNGKDAAFTPPGGGMIDDIGRLRW